MARSAKRPEKASRRGDMVHAGAVALGGFVSRNPVLVGGTTAFLVAMSYVSANALWYQPHQHESAFFSTRGFPSGKFAAPAQADTTINIERPEEAAAVPRPAADPTIAEVQGILKDLDLYAGTVDGIPGPATRKAIEDYRRMVGLPVTGEIDATLLEQLGAKPTTTAAITPTPAPAPRQVSTEITPTPVATGTDDRVRQVQAGLKAFGNDAIEIDGVTGSRTKAAIKEFQALFGLPETGEPDEVVLAKMKQIGLLN